KNLDFDSPEQRKSFYNCISACTIEDLRKYKAILSTEAFQKNPNQIASRLRLFLSKNIQDENQKKLFQRSLNIIVNNTQRSEDERYGRLAKYALIAAGLWDKVVPGHGERKFSD